jgi:iron complex outermembrane recepter protein
MPCGMTARAQVLEAPALSADIAAQALGAALTAFTRQTGLHIIYVSGVIGEQRSQPVTAGLGAEAALTQLLQGTGLRFQFLTPHSVRIVAATAEPTVAPPAAHQPAAALPEVLVTGSRIPVPANVTATSPLQVVTAQDIALSGHLDTVGVISALPQMTISSGADFGNFSSPQNNAGGFATADLRGLGPQRTVVLINGRRLGIGDSNSTNPNAAPDLDQIPLAMVERVEVLTGGASATYGSDAVAGVVNFIFKDHIQGVQVEGQYAFAQHSQQNTYIQEQEAAVGIPPPTEGRIDGRRRGVSVLAGTEFAESRGHITGYFIYQSQDAVYGADRDFTACSAVSTNVILGIPTEPGITCVLTPQSNIFFKAPDGDPYSVVGDRFVPWPAPGSVPPPRFNPASYFSSQREFSRYQAGLLARMDVARAITPYLEFNFMNDRTRTQLAPGGLFTQNNPLTADGSYPVNCSNPLLSAQEAGIICTPQQIAADRASPGSVSAAIQIGRRNIEGSGRALDFDHTNYRVVAGVEGRIGEAWRYNAYALYYQTSLTQQLLNFFSASAVERAFQVTQDAAGNPVCVSGGSCVPYDIFRTGGVTASQLAYLNLPAAQEGKNSEQIFEMDLTGELDQYGLALPWAHSAIALNAGAERRIERLQFSVDAGQQSGDLLGFGTAPASIDRSVSVSEAFMEVRVPVAQDRPFVKDLTFGAGYRYSQYSTAGATNTYRFDLQFAPIADMRLRASFDRVVRAPNLIELYTPLSYDVAQFIDFDPCAPTENGAVHAAASLAQCKHTGITAAQYGDGIGPAFGGTSTVPQCPAGCGAVSGGNPALVPETADTYSFGLTLTPQALPAFTASIDYFRIRLRGEIGNVPQTVTLQGCLESGDPTLCSQIVRTPAGGLSGTSVAGGGYVLMNSVNTGAATVSGIDLQGNYRHPIGRWGALSAGLNGSWLQHNVATPYVTSPSYDCAGLFGATCLDGSVNPTWRHLLRVTWETPWQLQLSAQWRFIGRTGFDNNSSQPPLQNAEAGFYNPYLTHIPNYSYLDLGAIWALTRNVQLRLAVNNVFDKDPPMLPLEVTVKAGNLNSFPTYDILGRNILLAVGATF